MPQNFLACDREQDFLMPPSLRDWLPDDHLAWFVLDAVEHMHLSAFHAAHRSDGHGRPAFDPAMMVALLLYAYAKGQRSSRALERACVEDVAYRVIAANQRPDHSTSARFRRRHEAALAGLFGEVLSLCAQAGLIQTGVIAVDGTKLHANASQHATRDYERIAREIPSRAADIDALEDERYGDRAATSCRPSSRPRRGGAGGCARRGDGWTTSAPRRPGRSRARVQCDCGKRSGAGTRSSRSNAARTPPTRPTAPAAR